jgi:hypothetical protein
MSERAPLVFLVRGMQHKHTDLLTTSPFPGFDWVEFALLGSTVDQGRSDLVMRTSFLQFKNLGGTRLGPLTSRQGSPVLCVEEEEKEQAARQHA